MYEKVEHLFAQKKSKTKWTTYSTVNPSPSDALQFKF